MIIGTIKSDPARVEMEFFEWQKSGSHFTACASKMSGQDRLSTVRSDLVSVGVEIINLFIYLNVCAR